MNIQPPAMPRVLIDMSNLRSGGGLQVAVSTLEQWASPSFRPPEWFSHAVIEVSTMIAEGICDRTRSQLNLVVKDRYWWSPRAWIIRPKFDVALVLFGPEYGRRRARTTIVGFGDGTVVNAPVATEQRRKSFRTEIRRRASRFFFRRADYLIVETEAARSRVADNLPFSSDRIRVIPNAYHPAFDCERPVRAKFPPLDGLDACRLLVFVGKGYSHKNHDFCGEVGDLLKQRRFGPFKFVFTLADDEWVALSDRTRSHAVNIGPVDVRELPELYARCDAGFFPSLLEIFSITPLEVLRSGRPLIAADRDYVRDVVGDLGYFFEPTEPESGATATISAFSDSTEAARRVELGIQVARAWPSSQDRAMAFVNLVDELAGS